MALKLDPIPRTSAELESDGETRPVKLIDVVWLTDQGVNRVAVEASGVKVGDTLHVIESQPDEVVRSRWKVTRVLTDPLDTVSAFWIEFVDQCRVRTWRQDVA